MGIVRRPGAYLSILGIVVGSTMLMLGVWAVLAAAPPPPDSTSGAWFTPWRPAWTGQAPDEIVVGWFVVAAALVLSCLANLVVPRRDPWEDRDKGR